MKAFVEAKEATLVRQVFAAWSIEIPARFDETWIDTDHYWHAYDKHRSVSLTSIGVTHEDGRQVSAHEIAQQMLLPGATPDERLHAGLLGSYTTEAAPPDARASHILSGIVAANGRALLVTVTADDLGWARLVWSSIRGYDARLPP